MATLPPRDDELAKHMRIGAATMMAGDELHDLGELAAILVKRERERPKLRLAR